MAEIQDFPNISGMEAISVPEGLAATFNVFAKTGNTTAVRVLLPALDSRQPAIQEGALAALLSRHEIIGHREILSRISNLPLRWRNIINQRSHRLTGVLRNVLIDPDESLSLNACRAAVMFENYDVIPAILAAMESGSDAKAEMAAEALLQLVLQLYDQIERPRDRGDRQDLDWSRRHVLTSLESSVQRFGRHKRREVVEAFLLLANRENAVLNRILHSPHHLCYLIMVDVFSKSDQNGIMRLLLNYLDDPRPPAAVLNVVSNRCDPKFVRYLLRHVGLELSVAVRKNLKRIVNFAWLKRNGMIDYLDNPAQHAAVQLVMASGIPRYLSFTTIKHLLLEGKPAGRREAARALAGFNGSDANALALRALEDADPQVQANILSYIRQRAIPGILPRLVKFMDSPHLVVRRAVQQSLADFSFPKFLNSFEMLDEDVQQSTGMLVKKVDPQTLPLLREELLSPSRSRRIKGLKIASALDLIESLETTIRDLMRDSDPEIRFEAALALDNRKPPSNSHPLEEFPFDNDYQPQENGLEDA